MLRSWEKIKELKKVNPRAEIVRNGDIIEVELGNYKGLWRIKSIINNNKMGLLFDMVSVDSIDLKSGKSNVRVKSLIQSKMSIIKRHLI